jgi:starch synthase
MATIDDRARPLRILMAASEVTPFAKTGGLGDVLGALPVALQELGASIHVVMPAYRTIDWAAAGAENDGVLEVWMGGTRRETSLRHARHRGVPVSFVVADEFFDRDHLYGGPGGDYPDNAERFAFFARAVLALATRLEPPPDVLHCHDWQTGLVPVFAHADGAVLPAPPRTVLTVHNLGYQGLFPPAVWPLLGLDWSYFTPRNLEFYGLVNFLKGGLVHADALTTVSRRYAEEILEPEQGHGLDGVLRERRDAVIGILNGVDYTEWDPAHDRHLVARYDAEDLGGKARCKAGLQAELGLRVAPHTPLLGMVSRLADQKGFDILSAVLPELLRLDLQLVILGSGDARYESALAAEGRRAPDRLAVRIAFDEPAAHRIEGGADAFLMPSRYEPCGLNQMYSLRYGTVPVVRATGGLDDTISEFDPVSGRGNGFKFAPYTPEALLGAIRRALDVYHRPAAWRRAIANGMACDFSWRGPAARYLELYRGLLQHSESAA